MSSPPPQHDPHKHDLVNQLGRQINHATHQVERAVRGVERTMRGLVLPTRFRKSKPGATPGIDAAALDQLPRSETPAYVTCIDYGPDNVQQQEISDLPDFLNHHRPEWSTVRWINVDGLTDPAIIKALAAKYQLHPLAIEDVLHTGQRPKAESYGGNGQPSSHHSDQSVGAVTQETGGTTTEAHADQPARLFIIARMLQLRGEHLHNEQISFFLGHKTVLTFQEDRGDVWDPIRARINVAGSRIRNNDASFLLYALLDAAVDHCFPILEHYGDRLEDLEDAVLENPARNTIHIIHGLKRELLLLRRAVWPMREMIHALQRDPHECMSENTRTFLRDVYDHSVQIIDIVETYREVATGLTETYMSSMSNKLNETMRVLTVIGTIFIPLTFLAGVYGMNFQGMPETESSWAVPWAYPIGFWGICLAVAGGLALFFKRRGWL